MNNSGGQNTFKGLNTQAKASLLLFLMNLQNSDFDSVVLEDRNWEDFTLYFKSGKKIIVESKDRKRRLSWGEIKSILNKILKRDLPVGNNDGIVIVCRSVNKELEDNIEYLKYRLPHSVELYKKHGFSTKQIDLLPRVKFFKIQPENLDIDSDDYLYQEALVYFSYQIPYWISESDLQRFMDSILVHEIYFKSEKGKTFTRQELTEKIEEYKREKIKGSYVYDPERKSFEERIETLIKAVKDIRERDRLLSDQALTAITAEPQFALFLLDYLKNKFRNLHLSDFDELWKATVKRLYAFSMLQIFEKNCNSLRNDKYILDFLIQNYQQLESPVSDTFNQEFALDLAKKIIDKRRKQLTEKAFQLVKAVLNLRKDSYKNLQTKRNFERERDLIAKLLYQVFEFYTKTNQKKKINFIIELIDKHFDLISDDGKFVLYTPHEIFWTLRDYILLDFHKNFFEVVDLIKKQYQDRYRGKFKGWDLIGGGISQSGNKFTLTDRHFITYTLSPALIKLYHQDKEKCWQFINERCIARKPSQIGITPGKKPDFLNRATIPILIKEYREGKYGHDAFMILSDFIRMKGIPSKSDLIFQTLDSDEFSNRQKWQLVKVSLSKYKGLPKNVFVKKIVSRMAAKGNLKAIKILEAWSTNQDFSKTLFAGELDIPDLVSKLLENSPDSIQFRKGVSILKTYFDSSYFKDKKDVFDVHNDAQVLAKLLRKDFRSGLEILEDAYKSRNLTTNQQILICSSIYKISDQKTDLLKIYKKFVKPKLIELLKQKIEDLDDLEDLTDEKYKETIEEKFTDRHAREYLVQFAEKLAKTKCFKETLWLIKTFIHDSDPPKDGRNYDDDPNGKFNEHIKIERGEDPRFIRTNRGWCAWVLDKFNRLEGRDYIEKIIPLVEKLADDPNHYVRLQAIVPLMGLVRIRHTHMPDNKKERFIPLDLAEKVENLAFKMLKDRKNWSLFAAMKRLAMLFSYMRSLTTREAQEALKIFLEKTSFPENKDKKDRSRELLLSKKAKLYDEVIKEIMALLVYYAEFRKKHFKEKKFKYIFEGKWEEIKSFGNSWFKHKLEELIQKGSPTIRASIAWHFWRLPQEPKAPFKKMFGIAVKYLKLLTNQYDHEAFKNIYRFIEDNIDKEPQKCLYLWKKCIETESVYFKQNWSKTELQQMSWWPFFYNGKILVKIYDHEGIEEFLKWFEILLDYPKQVRIAYDLDTAVEQLIQIRDEEYKRKIKKLLKKLVQRNLKYHEVKQKYLGGKN